jgi:hypothetical protein
MDGRPRASGWEGLSPVTLEVTYVDDADPADGRILGTAGS